MSTETMRASIDRDRCCELRLAGEIDIATVDGVIGLGLCFLNQITVARLVIGLGAVTFLDAGGLGALVVLRTAGREVGKSVELADVPTLVVRLLRITGLDTAFVTRSCPEPAPNVDPLGDLRTVVMLTAAAPTAQSSAADNTGCSEPAPTLMPDAGYGSTAPSAPPALTSTVPSFADPHGRDGLGGAA